MAHDAWLAYLASLPDSVTSDFYFDQDLTETAFLAGWDARALADPDRNPD